jgi:hypothetical protein
LPDSNLHVVLFLPLFHFLSSLHHPWKGHKLNAKEVIVFCPTPRSTWESSISHNINVNLRVTMLSVTVHILYIEGTVSLHSFQPVLAAAREIFQNRKI